MDENIENESFFEENNFKIAERTVDAKWHISCYSKDDKKRAKKLMNKIRCKNYELLENIDTAIKRLK